MLSYNKIKRPMVPALVFMVAGIVAGMLQFPPPLMLLPVSAGTVCIFAYKKFKPQKYYFIQIFFFLLLSIVGFSTTYIHDNYDNMIFESVAGEYCITSEGALKSAYTYEYDDTLKISATVDSVSDGTYSRRLMLKKCSVNGRRLVNNIVLEISDADSKAWQGQRGDYIELEAAPDISDKLLMLPDAAANPGQFDSRQYYKSLGYRYYIKDTDVTMLKRGRNLIIRGLEQFRKTLKQVYASCCTQEDAGVYEAIVTGDRSDMDDTVKKLFTAAGIGHILAISGLHISLIGMGLYRLLRRSGLMYPASAAISGIIVVLFGVMTGNGVSAVRAIVMFICAVIAQVLGRRYDILSAVSLSAIIIMLKNPYSVINSGFLLSFMAIAGVAVVSDGFCIKWLKWFTGLAAIWLATLPVMLWFYYEIPTYSIFLNLLVVPLMSFIMISALGCGLAGLVSPVAGCFFAGLGHYILAIFKSGCEWVLSLPYSVLVLGRPKLWQVILYYLLLIMFSQRKSIVRRMQKIIDNGGIDIAVRNGNTHKKTILISTMRTAGLIGSTKAAQKALIFMNILLGCVLVAALVILVHRSRNGLEVVFLDVGQGDAIYIGMPNGTNVFIDGGSSSAKNVYDKVIEPFLKYKGVRKIDFLFVTHGDADHENGWLEALDNSDSLTYIPKISNLILNSVDFVKYEALLLCEEKADMPDYTGKDKSGQEIENISVRMAERGTKVFDSEYGTTYWFGECSMVSLNACSDESPSSDSDNDNSIVLLLKYNDFSMLFTGDMTSKREAAVSASIKNYGISSLSLLKVGHHGSRYSSDEAFLANVMPETAVISCAEKNSYGHPHSEVIDRLEDIGAMIFRTDKSGAIIACVDNKSAYMTVCEYKTK